ncbi:MAG TPA: hypothetical protein VNR60_11770 [Croceibacterium sp.]|nr:hypothetical protein [Croceibacterium sp.]
MRRIIVLAALAAAMPARAEPVAVESMVYREHNQHGAMRIVPATRLAAGDRVVTILTWKAPTAGRYTAVSAVPARLSIESTSREGLEISTDGGRNWQALTDADAAPAGITHLRWPISGGDGRLSYRAVVR